MYFYFFIFFIVVPVSWNFEFCRSSFPYRPRTPIPYPFQCYLGSSSSRVGSNRSPRFNPTMRNLFSLLLCASASTSNFHLPLFLFEACLIF
ncbi:hypothetical protein Hanom_Chr06g00488251 [Helianthus anomalus]